MTTSLTPFHTFHLPVNARKIISVSTKEALRDEWLLATQAGELVLILGQGSNMLFLDDFDGTVLLNRLLGIALSENDDFYFLHVGGGENWHQLVEWSLDQGIGGLENLALIPGCAGSAPIQNIGAYGVEFESLCDFVEVMDLRSGEVFQLSREACQFGYRESVFKHQYRDHFAIIRIGLKLPKAWKPVLNYGSLAQFDPENVTPRQIFTEVCAVRSAKLPNPNEFGNAGSFFKNPIVPLADFQRILAAYPNVPHYPQADGSVKLPAGWLIDQCQLKGFQIGGAGVHTQQALVLINKGDATGQDVLALATHVRRQVREKFGVDIHPEVRFMGKVGEVDSEQVTR
ncbi:UDP-N-acetylenolpyruvoylglucosamine reductase [Pasteurellaceae bacterium Macca]|nr:UDP-N-acetylenolpyruvoylglucosamine reductase [Pasteurellaceae bacterium Macca]